MIEYIDNWLKSFSKPFGTIAPIDTPCYNIGCL